MRNFINPKIMLKCLNNRTETACCHPVSNALYEGQWTRSMCECL